MPLFGSMDVPAAGFSVLAARPVVVKLRRHWQYAQVRGRLPKPDTARPIRRDDIVYVLVLDCCGGEVNQYQRNNP